MTVRVRAAALVDADAHRTWGVLTDWPRQGEWIPATRVRIAGPGDARHRGGRLEAWTGIGPVGFLDTMEITVWEPPRRCEVVHTGRVVRGTGTFVVEALGADRCRVVWVERLELPFGVLGRVGWLAVGLPARLALRWSVRRFAAAMAAEAAP